jgi:putative FmdB family regulatory protein
MPVYGFICENCGNKFDRFLSIANREQPINEACEGCGEKKIQRDYEGQTSALTADSTVTPNKATGGAWGELMAKMKPGLPKYTHKNLDRATNRNLRRWQA